jgi:hypothetical protein
MSASPEAPILSDVGRTIYAAINACTNPDQLSVVSQRFWADV